MPLAEIFTFVGLCLDIIGVGLLVANEILTRRRDTAEAGLPDDYFIKHYEAILTEEAVRPDTPEEVAYERATNALPPRRALWLAGVGAALIIVGFISQAIALFVN